MKARFRYLLVFTLISIFYSLPAAAQVSVGPKLGFNLANFAFTHGPEADIKALEADKKFLTGPLAGLVFEVGISEAFSLQPEILFSRKGIKHDGEELKVTGIRNYVEVPVLAKFNFGSEIKFSLVGGPYVAYLVSGHDKEEIPGISFTRKLQFEYPEQNPNDLNDNRARQNRLDLGLALGAGAGFKLGPGLLNLESRFGLGLSDLNQYEKAREPEFVKVSNRSWSTSVTYLYPLGK